MNEIQKKQFLETAEYFMTRSRPIVPGALDVQVLSVDPEAGRLAADMRKNMEEGFAKLQAYLKSRIEPK